MRNCEPDFRIIQQEKIDLARCTEFAKKKFSEPHKIKYVCPEYYDVVFEDKEKISLFIDNKKIFIVLRNGDAMVEFKTRD